MADKFTILSGKIEELIQRLNSVKAENAELKQSSRASGADLKRIKKEYDRFRLETNDRSEKARARMTSILARLQELEDLGS